MTRAPDARVDASSHSDVSKPVPNAKDRLKRGLLYGAVGVAVVGAAYGVGRGQGAMQLREAREGFEAQAAEHQREAEAAREQAVAARQVRAHLEARRRLHRAVLALDERNFGIAQAHLAAAAAMLEQSGKGAEARTLADELRAVRLLATEDLASQRQPLVKWALRLDEIEPLQDP
jgi:hypothetical protein